VRAPESPANRELLREQRHGPSRRYEKINSHADEYPNGRFAELEDPEGNRIQLWEPNAASLARDPERVSPPD
jgi:hypothetical protein